MSPNIVAPLVDPWSFFDRDPSPSVVGPALVVVTSALLTTLAGVVTLAQYGAESGLLPSDLLFVAVFSGVTGLIGAVTSWGLYTVVFYGLSALVGGDGPLKTLFARVGWGFLPQVIGSAVSLAFVVVLDWWLGPAVTLVALLWSAVIWTAAIERSRQVRRRWAVAIVVAPVLATSLLALVSIALLGPV